MTTQQPRNYVSLSALLLGVCLTLSGLSLLLLDALSGRLAFLLLFVFALVLGLGAVAKLKSQTTMTVRVLRVVSIALGMSLFFGGIVVYYDAPIRRMPDGTYTNKTKSRIYTRAHYEEFHRWELTMICSFLGMFLVVGNIDNIKGDERKKS